MSQNPDTVSDVVKSFTSMAPPPEPVADPVDADKAAKEAELEAKLADVQQGTIQTQTVLTQLLADPNVKAVIDAKKAGQDVQVVPAGTGSDPDPDPNPAPVSVDFEEMSRGDFAKHLSGIVQNQLSEIVKDALGQQVKPLTDQVQDLSVLYQRDQSAKLATEITRLQAKYNDFNDFAGAIKDLNDTYNGKMPLETLYLNAKMEADSPVTPDTTVSSELPTGSSAKPSTEVTRKDPLPSGTPGFRQLLGGALDRLRIGIPSEE